MISVDSESRYKIRPTMLRSSEKQRCQRRCEIRQTRSAPAPKIILLEYPSEIWVEAGQLLELGRDLRPKSLRRLYARNLPPRTSNGRQKIELAVVDLPCVKLRRRRTHCGVAGQRGCHLNRRHSFSERQRQWPKQNCIDDAERRRVGTDAQPERQNGNCGKAWILP